MKPLVELMCPVTYGCQRALCVQSYSRLTLVLPDGGDGGHSSPAHALTQSRIIGG